MTQRKIAWFYSGPSNFEYDDLNRVTMFEDGNNAGIYARSHYQYDTVNREQAVWRDEDGSKGDRFSYSANNQLTGARYKGEWAWAGEPGNPDRRVDYTYTLDMLNRQSVSDNGAVSNCAHSDLNQYTIVGAQGLSYNDNRFNLTGYNGATFAYNAQNQLISASNPGTSAQFVYDGLGRCVKRTINGVTRFITYDEWNPLYEWDASGNPVGANIYGARADEIIGRWDSSLGFLFYKQDKQGNVVTLLDQGGSILERYRYDAFGKPTVSDWWGNPHVDGNNQPRSWYGNRFMFTGREYLQELGIYDYRHRMYHPGLGRFLQIDPMGFDAGDMNLFRYCDDDPVDGTDPTGLLNMWGNLEKFYSGNPSTNVVQDAWNQQRSPGLTMAPIADTRNAQAQSSSMRFVPQPGMTEDYRYHIYAKYRLTSDGKAVAGYDYSVKEKTKVIVNKFTGAKELVIVTGDKLGYQALPRSGIFTDRVGPRTQPSHNVSGELILEQRFLLQYKGHDGPQVSTVLQHVTKVTNGNVHNWVNVLTP